MTNYSSQSLVLKCDCTAHELHIEYDKALKAFFLSVWERSGFVLSFRQRVKDALKLLLYGKVCADDVVLSEESTTILKNWIDQCKSY